jgi:hypothetical protein
MDKTLNFKDIWKKSCSKYNIKDQPSFLPAVKRIIVIGDIHGDIEMTINTLKVAKLIKKKYHNYEPNILVNLVLKKKEEIWDGGKTVVVQVGDQIDRCRPNGKNCSDPETTKNDEGNDWKILQFFTELHHQARVHGGAIYSLMGNHELMNVDGIFSHVSYKGLYEFDDYKGPNGETFNSGMEARKWAFKPGNPVSEFLACTRQMSIIIGSNLFVHAGIVPIIAKKYNNIKDLNQLMSLYLLGEIKNSDYQDIFYNYNVSPLWNRVYGNMGLQKYNEQNCNELLEPLKEIYKVDRIFIGHTPFMKKGISSVCKKRIWLTDYGASKAFDVFDDSHKNHGKRSIERRAHVLEILDDYKMTILG